MMTAPPITTTPQNLASKVLSRTMVTSAPTTAAHLALPLMPSSATTPPSARITHSTLTSTSVVARSIE